MSLFDVTRAALEEVEDYLRVTVTVPQGPAVAGAAATDMIHLIAELVENATVFSPPHTKVFVHGEAVARGFVLEVEDRGLGITPQRLAEINGRLAEPPEFDLADSDRLGLFVVGRLAARHGVRVSLRPSPYNGIAAIVLIPQELMVYDAVPELSAERLADPGPAPSLSPAPSAGHGRSLPRRVRQADLTPQLRGKRLDALSPLPAERRGGTEAES